MNKDFSTDSVNPDKVHFMNPKLSVASTGLCCVLLLGLEPSFRLAAATFTDANWSNMGGLAGANGTVWAAVVDSSGNLYIGGDFTVVGDVTANHIAKWNGSTWSALGSGTDGSVRALAVLGTDLYAGGIFTNAGGVAANYIAKWNGNSWSRLGSGMNGFVYALAASSSEVHAGGAFTTAGGNAANYVAKWNGNSWSMPGSGMNDPVFALAASGSDVYAGGTFTNAGGSAANFIAKWNGRTWSALGSGANGSVDAVAVLGNDVYVGGAFTTVAKWDGSGWSTLGSGLNTPQVFALAVSGSEVYVGGGFTTAGGVFLNHVAKWNGSSWSALGAGMNGPSIGPSPPSPFVYALAVWDSNVYAGGGFAAAGGSEANYIAKWNGSSWSAVASQMGLGLGGQGYLNAVYALAVSGSDAYAGGFFTKAGGSPAVAIAKWDGSSWSALGAGMGGGPSQGPAVRALAVSDGDVYAAGDFTRAGGIAVNYVAKWNGSSWSALGAGMSDQVWSLAVSGTNLYAATIFGQVGKWNGSSWTQLGAMNDDVRALAVSGSDVYAGGDFTTAGGSPANHIARWNGSSWSAVGSGVNDRVHALAASGSNVYVGGNFTTAGGISANYIAKWDGSSWTTLGPGVNGHVEALAVSGNDLYAGGRFTTAGGNAAIAKWNGSSWSALGSGVNGVTVAAYPPLFALAASGADLYAGGVFTVAGEKASADVAHAYVRPLPTLSVLRWGSQVMVSWTSVDTAGFTLEQTGTLSTPASWVTNSSSVVDDGTNKSLTLPATTTAQFFRLRRP